MALDRQVFDAMEHLLVGLECGSYTGTLRRQHVP